MGIFDFITGKKPETSFYDEGYGDGQQYVEERPGLDERALAHAQISARDINLEIGLNDLNDEDWQSGFLDGYAGREYGDSYRQSLYAGILEKEENEKPAGFFQQLFG